MAKKSAKKTAQKVAKKTTTRAAQKTTKKKTTRKKRVLVCANDEQCFWVQDGAILQDLEQLAAAVATMSETVFKHHATGAQNDFAEWVEQVLHDDACARDLRKTRSQNGAKTVLIRHLRYYR